MPRDLFLTVIFLIRDLEDKGGREVKVEAEGVVRAEEEEGERGASQPLSSPRQYFLWEWVLWKSRELVREFNRMFSK